MHRSVVRGVPPEGSVWEASLRNLAKQEALPSPAHASSCRGPGWATLRLCICKTGLIPRSLGC